MMLGRGANVQYPTTNVQCTSVGLIGYEKISRRGAVITEKREVYED